MYPNQSKIDVFSREKRMHFDQYDDQINYFDNTNEYNNEIKGIFD